MIYLSKVQKGDRVQKLTDCAVHGSTAVITRADGTVAQGTLKRIREGEPVPPGGQLVWEKDGVIVDEMTMPKGPARVTSPEYRKGFDRVFGKKVN